MNGIDLATVSRSELIKNGQRLALHPPFSFEEQRTRSGLLKFSFRFKTPDATENRTWLIVATRNSPEDKPYAEVHWSWYPKSAYSEKKYWYPLYDYLEFSLPPDITEKIESFAGADILRQNEELYREMLDIVFSTPPEPEEMHEITGWDESRLTESINLSYVTSQELLAARKEWAGELGRRDASNDIPSDKDEIAFSAWTSDPEGAVTISINFRGIENWYAYWENSSGYGHVGTSFSKHEAPASGKDLTFTKRSQAYSKIQQYIRNAYDLFIKIVAIPVEPEEMHTITGWDESLFQRFEEGYLTHHPGTSEEEKAEIEAFWKKVNDVLEPLGFGSWMRHWFHDIKIQEKSWGHVRLGFEFLNKDEITVELAALGKNGRIGLNYKTNRVFLHNVSFDPHRLADFTYFAKIAAQTSQTSSVEDLKKILGSLPRYYKKTYKEVSQLYGAAMSRLMSVLNPVVEPEEMHEITGWDESLLVREEPGEPRIGDILETETGPDPIKAAAVVRKGEMWCGASIALARRAMDDGSPGIPLPLAEEYEPERVYEGYWTRRGQFFDRLTAHILAQTTDRVALHWTTEAIEPFLTVGRLMEAVSQQRSPDHSGLR